MKNNCFDKLFNIFILVSALVISLFLVSCEESRGNIEGDVYNKNGSPAVEMWIRTEKHGSMPVLIHIYSEGHYALSNVPIGKWIVSFYNHGIEVGRESAVVKSDETTTLDFTIGAKPPPENPERITPPY